MNILRNVLVILGIAYLGLLAILFLKQRSFLYFPSHEDSRRLGAAAGLTPWFDGDSYLGMKREPKAGGRIWLFSHGNGGQAAGRGYAMRYFNANDGVYIVEYPGYGDQQGAPSEKGINAAVLKAYRTLGSQFGTQNICVLGESLGSGPASMLGSLSDPPRRIVLVVPYDRITSVAQEKIPFAPVGLLMRDRWDNLAALSNYKGRLDIWGAAHDQVIPVVHARRLAQGLPQAKYHEINSGHGWADSGQVDLSEGGP